MNSQHLPVFASEITQLIKSKSPVNILDLTFGRGGYSKISLDEHTENKVFAFDLDPEAIAYSKEKFKDQRFKIFQANFKNFYTCIKNDLSNTDQILILADLGISSPQIDQPHRGMSYRFKDELLDLRFDPNLGEPAWKILKTLRIEVLEEILRDYGELKGSRRLANALKLASQGQVTTGQVFNICKDPSLTSRVFQAIRIYLNDELESLDQLLFEINSLKWENLSMAFVSFHSLEDRIVKRRAKEYGWKEINFFKSVSDVEFKINPRSRSAKLRIYEK